MNEPHLISITVDPDKNDRRIAVRERKGANPGLADFYSGHLPMFAASISPQVLEMHAQGKIRILVAGSPRKLEAAPDIPISSEVGFPDLITLQFMGVFAPGATPRPIIDKLAGAMKQIAGEEDVQKRFLVGGARILSSTPEGALAYAAKERALWKDVVAASGAKID